MTEEVLPEVYKVIGAPGTGKTTRVVGNGEIEDHTSLVQQNLEEYPLEDQMIVTYTNAGVDEAADRLEEILDRPRTHIDSRVTTIHSQCFQTLGLSRDDVVNWWDKKQFCDKYDMEFQGGDNEDDMMAGDSNEGNSFFDIYGWLQSNRKDMSEFHDCPQPWDGEKGFEFLAERWEQYKETEGKIGFSDMIVLVVERAYSKLDNLGYGPVFGDDLTTMEMFEKAREESSRNPDDLRGEGPFIDTEVLYVDEVQDLTPLQWEWYLAQKLVAEKVYIGGDDDQTIYGWAGANPSFMLDEEGDFEVLDKTYRIPADIWEVCDGVIHQVDKRQEKDVTPHGEGGEVKTHTRPSPRQIATYLEEEEDDSFILFRARYMIDNYTDHLHSKGIPYRNMSTFNTWDGIVDLRDGLAKMYQHQKGEDVTLNGDEVEAIKEHASRDMIDNGHGFDGGERAMGMLGGVDPSRVEDIIDMSRGMKKSSGFSYARYIERIVNDDDNDSLNYYQGEALKGNIRNKNWDMYPEDVRIGTIHSSKGKEASTVILALDTTETIMDNMMEDTRDEPGKHISDAERRLYYVGMTRSSERLVLCESMTRPQASLSLRNLLDEEHSEGGEVNEQQTISQDRGREW